MKRYTHSCVALVRLHAPINFILKLVSSARNVHVRRSAFTFRAAHFYIYCYCFFIWFALEINFVNLDRWENVETMAMTPQLLHFQFLWLHACGACIMHSIICVRCSCGNSTVCRRMLDWLDWLQARNLHLSMPFLDYRRRKKKSTHTRNSYRWRHTTIGNKRQSNGAAQKLPFFGSEKQKYWWSRVGESESKGEWMPDDRNPKLIFASVVRTGEHPFDLRPRKECSECSAAAVAAEKNSKNIILCKSKRSPSGQWRYEGKCKHRKLLCIDADGYGTHESNAHHYAPYAARQRKERMCS